MVLPDVISFDLFDTLFVVRGFEPRIAFEKSYRTLIGLGTVSSNELTYEDFYHAYRSKIRFYLSQRENTGKDFTNDELIVNMLKEFGINISLHNADKVATAYFDALLPYTLPFPKLQETLEILVQEYRLIITSNHSWPKHGMATLKKGGIQNLFTKITFSGDVGYAKPFSKIWEISTTGLNVKKNQILHIGDNPYTDVDGALKYGLKAIWLKSRSHIKYRKDRQEIIEPTLTNSKKYLGMVKELYEIPQLISKLE